jgi:hypothetical protein
VPGVVHRFLADDHARLDELLRRTVADPAVIDHAPYQDLRVGLLHHVAMEEKVLLAEARRRRGDQPLPLAAQLRADHAALAALLIPTPTHAIVATLRAILEGHNRLEEEPGGVYEVCEQLAGADAADLLARLRAVPAPRVAAYRDDPRVHEHIARLLRERHEPR